MSERRAEARVKLDQLLEARKVSPDGSLFDPGSLQNIRSRLEFIEASECKCNDSPHENAIHDLAENDLPALLEVIEDQSARLAALEQTVTRVRELHSRPNVVGSVWGVCQSDVVCSTIRALDGTEAP